MPVLSRSRRAVGSRVWEPTLLQNCDLLSMINDKEHRDESKLPGQCYSLVSRPL
jgi:hypothetical protein